MQQALSVASTWAVTLRRWTGLLAQCELAPSPPARAMSILAGRATCVPDQTDTLGIERTTTVTAPGPLAGFHSLDQLVSCA
jgi:hypothetical protein